MLIAICALAFCALSIWWGYYNYKLGLRQGEALGTYQTLLKVMEPEELGLMLAEQEMERQEVEELRRIYKGK